MEALIGMQVLVICQFGPHRSVVRGVIEPYVMPLNVGSTRYPSRSVILVAPDGREYHLPPVNGKLLSITAINEEGI